MSFLEDNTHVFVPKHFEGAIIRHPSETFMLRRNFEPRFKNLPQIKHDKFKARFRVSRLRRPLIAKMHLFSIPGEKADPRDIGFLFDLAPDRFDGSFSALNMAARKRPMALRVLEQEI